jgi:hypothetical protein
MWDKNFSRGEISRPKHLKTETVRDICRHKQVSA